MPSPKDVRIVVVSWNNEKQLGACLSSLPAACDGLVWDVVVVDNASNDKSVEVAQRFVGIGGQVIANNDNRGFAKACNQALTDLDARYVLLLNPDTECPAGSLTALVRAGDTHPEAAVIGPKLINTDGSAQTSIRRFPVFWSQIGVMLKLHNLFPGLFRYYFGSDLPLDREQDVDSVMGACFLIRRKAIEQIGGLDERYFIWFEEVDYCRQAHANGWTVHYAPQSEVIHHGGQSFSQVMALKKQQYFNASMLAYFRKWHAGWQAVVLQMLQPISIALAWLAGMTGLAGKGSQRVLKQKASAARYPFLQWVAVILGIEVVSALTIFTDAPNAIACIIAGLIMVVLGYKRPTLALSVIALELMIGSQGRLLQIWGWPGFLSLRMVLSVGFFAGWIARSGRGGPEPVSSEVERWPPRHNPEKGWQTIRQYLEWVLLGAVLTYAFIRGVALNHGPILADANAWVFALLIVPVIDLARREGERLKRDILPVLIVGPIWLALKALGLEYMYAHGFAVVDPPSAFHLWVRRTGTGEVTPLGGGLFRIFMQSFIFALPALFFWISKRFTTHEKGVGAERRSRRMTTFSVGDVVGLAACVTFILGLSRSMWLGALAGLILLIILHAWKGRDATMMTILDAMARLILVVGVAWSLTVIVRAAPPFMEWSEPTSALSSRVTTNDASGNSRRALLDAMILKIKEHPILGSGFGATVSYKSSDPRVLAENPNGLYTTYAFEWGWLEHWIKFGIVGFLVMIWLIVRIGQRILRTPADDWLKYAMLSSLVALVVTHVFTPYLNHPLGLGYLIMLEGWVALSAKKTIL